MQLIGFFKALIGFNQLKKNKRHFLNNKNINVLIRSSSFYSDSFCLLLLVFMTFSRVSLIGSFLLNEWRKPAKTLQLLS